MRARASSAPQHRTWVRGLSPGARWIVLALACGIVAPIVYVATDLLAGASYPGYSFFNQAVSELFAIGAPTSGSVVRLFSVSSLLMAAFAWGVRWAPDVHRGRLLAWLVALNAADSLLLWNLFPMHMRGALPTFTDTMHGVLAVNPFPLLTILLAAFPSRGWFRVYSIATVVFVGVTALSAFVFVPAFLAQQPTPWMGLAERAGQYAHQAWHAVFAWVLLRRLRF
jgi:hypothetical protein